MFNFLRKAYSTSDLQETRLASDQTHFYIMVTSLLRDGLLKEDTDQKFLIGKLVSFGKLIGAKSSSNSAVEKYLELSSRQTTDAEKRKDRQKQFVLIVNSL